MIKNVFSLLNSKLKIEVIFLFFLNFFVAFLEVVSIGSIPVFLMYMLNPEKFIEKIPFSNLKIYLNDSIISLNQSQNLKWILLSIVLIFVAKNLLILFNSAYQAFFNRRISTLMTSRLFNHYLSKKYYFFINSKPSELIKNLESVEMVRSIIIIYLSGIKEILMISGLLIMIAISNFKIFLTLIVLGTLFAILHKFKISDILVKFGKKNYIYQENRYSLINEFFGSIMDIKITNKESFFSKLFKNSIWSYETSRIVEKLINLAVRPLFEILGVVIMVWTIYFFTLDGKTFSEIIPVIALLSLSLIRVLPSCVLLINYTNKLKFESSQLNYLVKNISLDKYDKSQETNRLKINFKNKIEIKNLSFFYPESKINSLSNINLSINRGDSIGIIGRTGSGKSTLINTVSNLLKFTEGKVIFDDKTVLGLNDDYIIKNLHYIRQDIYLLNDSIEKNVSFGEDSADTDINFVKECLVKAGLSKYTDKLDLVIGNKGSKISGGENQQLGLARAFYRRPDLLFLDEPTSNLDYKNEQNYFESIKKLNITSLVIAHRVQTLDYCDKIILMKDGKINDQGNLEYFKQKYQNFTNYID